LATPEIFAQQRRDNVDLSGVAVGGGARTTAAAVGGVAIGGSFAAGFQYGGTAGLTFQW